MSAEFVQKYSHALYEVSKEVDGKEFLKQTKELRESFQNVELKQFLTHPKVGPEEKKAVVKEIFEGEISSYLLNFLYILVDNRRVPNIDEILEDYETLYYEMNHIDRIKVISAVALSQEKLDEIARAYKKGEEGEVLVNNEVDPSILGGVILKVDNRVFDRSIRRQLEEMEKKLHQQV